MKHNIRVRATHPINQDTTTFLLLRTTADGRQLYARDIEWVEYRGLEMLDTSKVTFPGDVEVRMV